MHPFEYRRDAIPGCKDAVLRTPRRRRTDQSRNLNKKTRTLNDMTLRFCFNYLSYNQYCL